MKVSFTAHAPSAGFGDELHDVLGGRLDRERAEVLLEVCFARVRVQGARAPEQLMKSHDIGASPGSSSAGGHGLSPLPAERSR